LKGPSEKGRRCNPFPQKSKRAIGEVVSHGEKEEGIASFRRCANDDRIKKRQKIRLNEERRRTEKKKKKA